LFHCCHWNIRCKLTSCVAQGGRRAGNSSEASRLDSIHEIPSSIREIVKRLVLKSPQKPTLGLFSTLCVVRSAIDLAEYRSSQMPSNALMVSQGRLSICIAVPTSVHAHGSLQNRTFLINRHIAVPSSEPENRHLGSNAACIASLQLELIGHRDPRASGLLALLCYPRLNCRLIYMSRSLSSLLYGSVVRQQFACSPSCYTHVVMDSMSAKR